MNFRITKSDLEFPLITLIGAVGLGLMLLPLA